MSIASQFNGLPMESLIGGPLQAACNAQVQLAKAEADFINEIGLIDDGNGNFSTRTIDFIATRPATMPTGEIIEETISISAPVLAIVPIPALLVDEVDIRFNMEVKNSTEDKSSQDAKGSFSAKAGWGPFSVKISGSVSSHKESTRKTDNSAKYDVRVHAKQMDAPEGLMRILDHLITACEPRKIESNQTYNEQTGETSALNGSSGNGKAPAKKN
ncbi:DUF2589 domain-containing protein [Pelagibaculum spongiae]|uniref:DUF2589 domain-containing protein n=1 Tax=Pelagibaculum spongiae TaxID=2080658 RepID=A0A2V1H496_9GAMM|nr:DUF2589 domain-containing protein [Pelagibaculum spongiae]PVZ72048.1 hypothetical protein DC094_03240 [Pelagibaculum spongiae]